MQITLSECRFKIKMTSKLNIIRSYKCVTWRHVAALEDETLQLLFWGAMQDARERVLAL